MSRRKPERPSAHTDYIIWCTNKKAEPNDTMGWGYTTEGLTHDQISLKIRALLTEGYDVKLMKPIVLASFSLNTLIERAVDDLWDKEMDDDNDN